MPFGFPSEKAFSFAGIPTALLAERLRTVLEDDGRRFSKIIASSFVVRPIGLRLSIFSTQTRVPNSRQKPKSLMASGWTTIGHPRQDSARRRPHSSSSHAGSNWLGACIDTYSNLPRAQFVRDDPRTHTLGTFSPVKEFWWLNNGITVLADSCSVQGDRLTVTNPEIVNGLQTSHEIFSFYSEHSQAIKETRSILLRVIVPPDEKSGSLITKATNFQTEVRGIVASLLATFGGSIRKPSASEGKSPAPPLVALAGLLGMVWGEQLIERFLAHKSADAHISSAQDATRATR
jgi:hypothetical protein